MFNWFKKKSVSEKDFLEIIDKLVARLVDAQGGAISSIIKGVNEIDSENCNPEILGCFLVEFN